MELKKKWEKAMQYVQLLTEGMYLTVLVFITAYAFLKTTTIPIPWNMGDSGVTFFNELPADIPLHLDYLLLFIIICRCISSRKYAGRNLLLSAGILGMVYYAVSISSYGTVLLLTLLILGARDISFERMMKAYTVTVGALLVITVAAALTGMIENLRFGQNGRLAFGIVYSTDFAAHVFFLMLCIWYVRGKRAAYLEACLAAVLGLAVYIWSDARCSAACLFLLALLIAAHRWMNSRYPEKLKQVCQNQILTTLLALSFPIASACMVAASVSYQENVGWMDWLDKFMSRRLYYGKQAISVCGFHLWGKQIRMNGHWADGRVTNNYFYLDSSYMQMTLMFGLAVSVLALLAFLWIGCKAQKKRHWILLWILALISVHGLIEQRIWSLSYCPFILALFAKLDKKQEVETVRWKRKP